MNSALRIYSKFLVLSVLFLIFVGALVTSNNAGLTVPDWPSTYGYNMFLYPLEKWVGGIFYEHSHRLIASVIGFLTLVFAVWVAVVEKRKGVKWFALGSLAVVICQGILGGLTVLLKLPPQVSVLHGVLGQTFLCMLVILAYWFSKEWNQKLIAPASQSKAFFRWGVIAIALVYLQLIAGAIMRHTHSGLAVLDFPTMGGSWVPSISDETLNTINEQRLALGMTPVDAFKVVIHLIHRFGAFVVAGFLIVLINRVWALKQTTSPYIVRSSLYLSSVLLLQITLGILTVFSKREPIVTSVHVLTGALLLGLAVLFTLRAYNSSRCNEGRGINLRS